MGTLLQGYVASSFIGQSIVILIVLISIFSWGIIMFRAKAFRHARKDLAKFHQLFDQLGGNLDALYEQTCHTKKSAAGTMFMACYREIHRLATREGEVAVIRAEVVEGVERVADSCISETEIDLQSGLPALLMVASISPLLGLLGTVWGILEVFQAMDQSTSPSIADIAPGISAALVTTVFGLLAAIPAAASYNLFQVRLNRLLSSLENLASQITNILVRHQIRQRRARENDQS